VNEPLRIAVADDAPEIRDFFGMVLRRLDHQVVAMAETGAELINLCRTAAPDLVITDVWMPGVDGIEAAKQITRERPLPVILVSAQYDSELIERAEASRIMAFLVKPIKAADLAPAINLAVQRFKELCALQDALARVKQLHGLLQICMYCKKIRDDHNYWQQVEAYISRHSEAQFSHGICPACYEEIVKPGLTDKNE